MDRWSDESVERVLVGRRAVRRTRVCLDVEVNLGGTGWLAAELLELSVAGYRLRAFPFDRRRKSMWLRAGSIGPLAAKVVWFGPEEVGCAFLHPIKRVLVEELLRPPEGA